jgi:hypothetical protein
MLRGTTDPAEILPYTRKEASTEERQWPTKGEDRSV